MSKRKLLLIGGTGTISTAITRSMAIDIRIGSLSF